MLHLSSTDSVGLSVRPINSLGWIHYRIGSDTLQLLLNVLLLTRSKSWMIWWTQVDRLSIALLNVDRVAWVLGHGLIGLLIAAGRALVLFRHLLHLSVRCLSLSLLC